jgi:hypothetical protein
MDVVLPEKVGVRIGLVEGVYFQPDMLEIVSQLSEVVLGRYGELIKGGSRMVRA